MNLTNKWLITLDDENWSINNYGEFNTEEEVLEFINSTSTKELDKMWERECGDHIIQADDEALIIYYGQVQEFVPSVDAENILENISESAYSEVGEYAEQYLYDVPKEQIEELEDQLNEVLHKWMKKYNHEPHFYIIVKEQAETISIEEEF